MKIKIKYKIEFRCVLILFLGIRELFVSLDWDLVYLLGLENDWEKSINAFVDFDW